MERIRNRRRAHATALLTLLSCLALAPHALAADPDWPDESDTGWRKVLAYSRCALQVFSAVTPPQWGAAVLDCTRLFLSEPAPGSGGP